MADWFSDISDTVYKYGEIDITNLEAIKTLITEINEKAKVMQKTMSDTANKIDYSVHAKDFIKQYEEQIYVVNDFKKTLKDANSEIQKQRLNAFNFDVSRGGSGITAETKALDAQSKALSNLSSIATQIINSYKEIVSWLREAQKESNNLVKDSTPKTEEKSTETKPVEVKTDNSVNETKEALNDVASSASNASEAISSVQTAEEHASESASTYTEVVEKTAEAQNTLANAELPKADTNEAVDSMEALAEATGNAVDERNKLENVATLDTGEAPTNEMAGADEREKQVDSLCEKIGNVRQEIADTVSQTSNMPLMFADMPKVLSEATGAWKSIIEYAQRYAMVIGQTANGEVALFPSSYLQEQNGLQKESKETQRVNTINTNEYQKEMDSISAEINALRELRSQSEQFASQAEKSGNTQAFETHKRDAEELTAQIQSLLEKWNELNSKMSESNETSFVPFKEYDSELYKRAMAKREDARGGEKSESIREIEPVQQTTEEMDTKLEELMSQISKLKDAEKNAMAEASKAVESGEQSVADTYISAAEKYRAEREALIKEFNELNAQRWKFDAPIQTRSFKDTNPDIYKEAMAKREQDDKLKKADVQYNPEEAARFAQWRAERESRMSGTPTTNTTDGQQHANRMPEFANIQELEARINAVRSLIDDTRTATQNGNLVDIGRSAQDVQILESELRRLEGIRNAITGGRNQEPTFYESINSARELEGVIQQLKEQIAQTRANLQDGNTSDFEGDVAKLRDYERALKELSGVRNIVEGPDQNNMMTYSQLLDAIKAKKHEITNAKWELAKSTDIQADTQRLQALEKELANLQKMKQTYQSSTIGGMIGKAFADVGNNIKDHVVNGLKHLPSTIIGIFRTAVSGIKSLFSGIERVFSPLINGAKSVASAVGHLASAGFDRLKSAASFAGNGIKALAQGGFNLLRAGAERGIQSLRGVISSFTELGGKVTNKLLRSLKSVKSMLMRRVKRMFISSIFNQLKEGFQALAKVDENFNQAMSNVKNATKELSGNLVALLGNLFVAVEPALTSIIEALSTAVSYISAFISMLMGGSATIRVAKKSNDDYAKSLNKAGKAASGTLAKFDELNVIGQESGGSGSGGSGIEFEEKEISGVLGGLNGIFEQLVNQIKNGEWEEAGKTVGGMINSMVSTIDQKILELTPKVTEWSGNIARLLNGIVEGTDFVALGGAFGHGLNFIVEPLENFFNKFDFVALGTQIGNAINGFVDQTNWTAVGSLLGKKISSVWQIMAGIAKQTKWDNLGKKLGTAIKNMLKNLDWKSWKEMVSRGFTGIVTALYNLMTTAEFPNASEDFAKAINGVFEDIDWKDIGEKVSGMFNIIIDTLSAFVKNLNFNDIGEDIGDLLETALKNINWDNIGDLLTTSVNGLIDIFDHFVSDVDWVGISKDAFSSFLNAINNINWEKLSKTLSTGVNKLVKIIGNLVDNPTIDSIAEKLGKAAGDFFKNVDWVEMAGVVRRGIKRVTGAFAKFTKQMDIPGVAKAIANGLNSMFSEGGKEEFKQAASNIASGVNDVIAGFSQLIADPPEGIDFDGIASSIGESIATLIKEADWGRLVANIGNGAIKVTKALGDLVATAFGPTLDEGSGEMLTFGQRLARGINSVFTNADGTVATEKFEELGKSIGAGISSILSNIIGIIGETDWGAITTGLFTFLANAFHNVFGAVDEEGKTLGKRIAESINKIFTSFDDADLNAIGQNITQMLVDGIGAIADFIENINISGIVDGIVGLFGAIDWGTVVKKLIDFIGDALGKLVEGFGKLLAGIINLVKSINWIEVGDAIITGIIDGIKELIAGGFDASDAILRAIFGDDVINKIAPYIGLVKDGVQKGVDTVVDIVEYGAEKVGEYLLDENNISPFGLVAKALQQNEPNNVQGTGRKASSKITGATDDYYAEEWNNYQTKNGGYQWVAKALIGPDFGEAFISYLNDTLFEALNNTGLSDEQKILLVDQLEESVKSALKENPTDESFWQAVNAWLNESGVVEFTPQVITDGMIQNTIDAIDSATEQITAHGTNALLVTQSELSKSLKDVGITLSASFREELSGQTASDIHEALILLGAGISEDTITALNVEGLHDRLSAWMEETGTSYEQILSSNATAITAVMGAFGVNVSSEVISALNDAEVSGELTKWMEESGMSLDETVVALMALMGEDVTGIAGTIGTDVGDKLGGTIPEALAKALGIGEQQVAEAKGKLTEAASQSVKDKEAIEGSSKEAGEGATGELKSAMDDGKADVGEAAEGVKTTVEEKFEALPDEVKPYAETMLAYITAAITEGDGTVFETIEEMASGIVQRVEDTLSGTKGAEITKAFLDGMKEGISTNEDTVKAQIETTSGNLITTFSTELATAIVKPIGEDFLSDIVSGITDSFSSLASDVRTVGLDLCYEMKDAISWGAAGYEISYYIMQGLVDGLVQNQNAVHNVAYNVAKDIVDTFQKELKIKSPSKVFETIGDYSMQGLQIGLEGQEDTVLNSVSNIAGAITDEMSGNTELGYTFDGVTNGLNSVIDALSDVASQFVAVAQAIKDMGGLEIPAIAEGRTIPYSTRITETTEDLNNILNDVGARIDATNAEQMELLIEQNNLLRELLEKSFTVNVTPSAAWGKHNAQSMKMYTKLTGG